MNQDNVISNDQIMEQVLSVGQKLVQARADCGGLSLETISEELCIRPHLLAALEQDDFNIFPSSCYAAGFLKNYAAYLGLNSGQIVSQYKTEYNGSTKKVDLVFLEPERRHDYSQQIIVSLIILSILVLYGIWYFTAGQKNITLAALPDATEMASRILVSVTEEDTPVVKGQITAENPQNDRIKAVEDEGFHLVQRVKAETVEPSFKPTAVAAEQVRLIARQDSWVRIMDSDQDILVDRILLTGEEFQTTDHLGMTLMTSNAGALSIYVGNLAVAPLGKIGEIRQNISLDRQDLLVMTAQLSR